MSKEVKNALKAAREAIRNKDFKEALKHCKAALAEDKNNYNALVFVGVAAEGMEQYDQALKAYHRATEAAPDQLLAWQGLSSMHTKNPDQVPREDIVNVYEKLIELYQNDADKLQEAMRKLIPLYADGDFDKAMALYDKLEHKKEGSVDDSVLVNVIHRLQAQPSLSAQQEAKLLSCLRSLLSSPNAATGHQEMNVEKHVRSYLLLVQKREAQSLYKECSRLEVQFPTCPFPQELRLRLLLDRQMDKSSPDETEEIRKLTAGLTELTTQGESNAVLLLGRGYLSLMEGKLPAAREALQEGVKKMPTCYCGLYYLCVCLFRLHATAAYLSTCQQALGLLSSKTREVSVSTSGAVQRLHEMAVRCCLQQGGKVSLDQASEHLKEVQWEGSGETVLLQAYLCLELNDQEQLQSCLESLKSTDSTAVTALRAWVDYHQQRYTEATTKLQQCVGEEPGSADYLLMLGRALWERRGEGASVQEQCFNTLLKAAKLDPYLSGTFLYLGHFYTELKKDQQRGKKCYQKAYDLNPSCEEAGAALCDLMAAMGEEESVQKLLQRVTDTASAGCAKWAWLRLGLAQVRTGDPSTAIASLQSALRADPSDRHVWECLAEAYLNRGSYTAALKAFTKAVELYPDSIYSLYKLASIKQALGSLREAVEEYDLILQKDPQYVPALKGLGETYLQLAHKYLTQGLLGLAVDTCQQALTCLTRAAGHRPDLSCLWKLMGDCCSVLHPLHPASFQIRVPSRLCQSGSSDSTVLVDKAALMQLGARCYGQALKILPDSASLWHDLGLGLFYLSRELTDQGERKSAVDRSIRALKKALTLDPGHHRHWTALGVVTASPDVENFALAQHCFIKSVQCEANNAVAWTNLGTLYLRSDNIQLAHEAFKVAQSLDPELVGSWVGQALVAEAVEHQEAMDLFRHTTLLAIHPESCAGYGHWVVSTLLDVDRQHSEAVQYCIHQMAAVPAACDALTRYTELKKEDPRGFNMLGLLLEHQDLHLSALAAFTKASELGQKWGLPEEQRTLIELNKARLLSKQGRYTEAVEVYKRCAQSFGDVCQWALALCEEGQLQDSYLVYQKALGMAEMDRDRSDVWAALGMVSYKGGNWDDAKTALFQSFQLSTPSVQGLLALCALGVMQRDATLTQATLQELSGLVAKTEAADKLCDFARLTAAFKLSQGEVSEALSSIQALLKESPPDSPKTSTSLHLLSAQLALHSDLGHTALSSAVMALNSQYSDLKVKDSAMVALTLAQLYVGQHSRRKVKDNALRSAQKAFLCRPNDVSSLCCLAAALHAEAVINFISKGDTALMALEVTYLDLALTRPKVKVTAAQRSWCVKQKAVAQLMMGDLEGCRHTLDQLGAGDAEASSLASVLRFVVDDAQSGLEPLVLRDGTPLLFWQILVGVMVRGGQWKEAGVVVREALQRAQSHSGQVVKVVCLVTMVWLAAKHLMTGGVDSGDVDGLMGEVEEACEAVSTVSDLPYTLTQLLLGLLHRLDNPRKAKHHFANVLEEGRSESCFGVDVSLARRGILCFLHASTRDSDQQLVQKLLSDAEASDDLDTTQLYKTLTQ